MSLRQIRNGRQQAFYNEDNCSVSWNDLDRSFKDDLLSLSLVDMQIVHMAAHSQMLQNAPVTSDSADELKSRNQQSEQINSQWTELGKIDEKFLRYADQSINFDLDAGVKLSEKNYGVLLTEVKAQTGNLPKVKI